MNAKLLGNRVAAIVLFFCAVSLSHGSTDTFLYLRAGATNIIFTSSTANTLQATAGTSPAFLGNSSLLSPVTFSYDFYSPPLTTNQTLANGDGIGANSQVGFTNYGALVYIVTTATATAYDYDPATGNSTAIASTTALLPATVSPGSTASAKFNSSGTTTTGYTIARGHMVRINLSFIITGLAINFGFYYNGNTGDSATAISFPHGEPTITWPFGPFPTPPSFATTNSSATNVVLTSYLGLGGLVNIPAVLNGLTVSSIGTSAFSAVTNLTTVVIPATVTNIGNNAFQSCTNLTAIYFAGNAPILGSNVFAFDTNLVVYYVPGALGWGSTFGGIPTAPWIQFQYLTNLGSPQSLTLTGYTGAGGDVTLATNIGGIPVTAIASNAFAQNPALTNVTSGPAITNIGDGAFAFCTNLAAVYFQGNAPTVGSNVFGQDTNLIIYYVQGMAGWATTFAGIPTASLLPFTFTTNVGATPTVTLTSYIGAGGTVTVPTNINGLTVTAIASNAFYQNGSITNLIIGAGVTNIGVDAFYGCTNLVSVQFQGDAPAVGLNVFGLDTNVTIYYPAGAAGWGTIFAGVSALSEALSVGLTSPTNNQSFTTPATFQLSATVSTLLSNSSVSFYEGATYLGTVTSAPFTITVSNLAQGSYVFTAAATNVLGVSALSALDYVTVTNNVVVSNSGSIVVDFDALNTASPVTPSQLATYLARYGVSLLSNSPGSSVTAVNQTNIAAGNTVSASSGNNILTASGGAPPLFFTIGFSPLLSQFSFTRPALIADPSVSLPAWQAQAFDSLGILLDEVSAPQISSFTNVPAQVYTLSGGGIASVKFTSQGSGLNTVNSILLDDFALTPGVASNLLPSVLISQPGAGQVFSSDAIPIQVQTAPGSGVVTAVTYYCNGLPFTNVPSPFSIVWNVSSNGVYVFNAVVINSAGLTNISAPLAVTVATGFAIVSQPLSQTIAVGGSATFNVNTTGTNVTYQWSLNGADIIGATNATYAVSNAALNTAGNYTVTAVSGSNTIQSTAAVLAVLSAPVLSQPSIVTNGGDIVLTFSASDTVPFYYVWQLNGDNIPGATNSCLPGNNQISFTISNATLFDSGNYQLTVANAVASQISPPVDVTVGAPGLSAATNYNFAGSINLASLTKGPPVVAVLDPNVGSPSPDGLQRIAGKEASGFLWYNWTADFTGVASLTTRGSTFDTLLGVYTGTPNSNLTSVAEDDDSAGFFTSLVSFNCVQGTNYQIVVAGYHGASGVVVLGPSPGAAYGLPAAYSLGGGLPAITRQPGNQLAQVGGSVTLTVSAVNATGYQWFFEGVPVEGGTSNVLVLTNFSSATVGGYFAQATNAAGSVQSAAANVQIASASPNNVTARVSLDKFGDAADVTVSATKTRYRPSDSGGDGGGFTLSQSFSTVGATKEANEPNHAGQPGGASYWYTYRAPASGAIQFDTSGSFFNTILAVYTGPGDSFATLVNMGSGYTTNYIANGQPVVLVSNVTAGTTFYIAVDGYLGGSGAAQLNVAMNPPPIIVVNTNNSSVPPLTNNDAVIMVTVPPDNYLTTDSTVDLRGVLRSGSRLGLGQTSVQVTVNGAPPVPATIGPAGASATWSLPAVALAPGANVITVQASSFLDNGAQKVSYPVTRTVFYALAPPSSGEKSLLTLQTIGSGRITGVEGQQPLEVNNVYKVNAVPAPGWIFSNWSSGTSLGGLSVLSNGPAMAFLMSSNLILQATFVTNPFPPLAGVYNGLFYPTNGVAGTNSGFFKATLGNSGRGSYSAKLLLDGGTYPFHGVFDLSGNTGLTVSRPGKSPLTVLLHLNSLTNGNQISGMIYDQIDGWSAPLQADLAVVMSKTHRVMNDAGRYTLIFTPGQNTSNQPSGCGYASLTIGATGQVQISGQLGDGSAFNQGVGVSQDGYIPLYASLNSGKNSVLGWLNLTNNPTNVPNQWITGDKLSWIKTSNNSGFTNSNVGVFGSAYVPPPPGREVLSVTNGTLTISNAADGLLIYSNVMITENRLLDSSTGLPNSQIQGQIVPSTGILTVTFQNAGASGRTVAKGVILQECSPFDAGGLSSGNGGVGYFLLQQ